MKKFTLAILWLLSFELAAQIANPSQLIGQWQIDEDQSQISLRACEDRPDRLCGYLSHFESTGNSQWDDKLCQLQLVGELLLYGQINQGGWFYSPENDQAYRAAIVRADPNQLTLRIAELNDVSQSIEVTWQRIKQPGPSCNSR